MGHLLKIGGLILLGSFLFGCSASRSIVKEIEQYRAEKIRDITVGERHPLEPSDVEHLRFYAVSRTYRVLATFTRDQQATPFDMATYSGRIQPYRRYGHLNFTLDGKPYRLAVYQSLALINQEKYRDYLFLPFKDATNAIETYGGGRYINLSTQDIKNDKLILDFNKAYNPWCAYSDGYNCPIPPAENHLSLAIRAGEKNYAGDKKHQ